MATTPVRTPPPGATTWLGVALFVGLPTVPSPNAPAPSLPQAQTVPSPLSARLWKPPPAMATTPVRNPPPGAATRLGVALLSGLATVPSPSCPQQSSPQAQTVPSLFSARP